MTLSRSASDLAASRSPARKASVAAATPSLTRAKSCTTFWSISSRSRWKATLISSGMALLSPPLARSAEAAGDVVLGPAVVGLGEDLVRRSHLDHATGLAGGRDVEEGCRVADA